jgi:membrane-associated protein
MGSLIDFVLHLDLHLKLVLDSVGPWGYLLFFAIIFAETGLVVTPFLPGDSLVFALGALAAVKDSPLNIGLVYVILSAAAIVGDSANYAIGKYFGSIILKKQGAWFLKKEHIDRTHRFYEKYGSKTIVLARFVPIVRTFAPFVAGVGRMNYTHFLTYNVVGGLLWITLFSFGGYFFGNIPVVKNNFGIVIIAIIILSILPAVIEIWKERRRPSVAGAVNSVQQSDS